MKSKFAKSKAQELLRAQISKAQQIIEKIKACDNKDKFELVASKYYSWLEYTKSLLLKIFPTSKEKEEFYSSFGIGVGSVGTPALNEVIRDLTTGIDKRIVTLGGLIERLDIYYEPAIGPDDLLSSFWSDIHPKIISIVKSRFESRHYADAVESAFKEINSYVKEIVKRKSGKEMDGASLMKHAFSQNSPVIVLGDLSTDSGKNMQIGYMEIFAGSMTGIRNPKAHGNLDITKIRAIHFIYLASLLMSKIDERI